MTSSLVGSEMCIRDRSKGCAITARDGVPLWFCNGILWGVDLGDVGVTMACLLYTSDAADDM
eukprot:684844-Prorocentrum_lima.AAC.1